MHLVRRQARFFLAPDTLAPAPAPSALLAPATAPGSAATPGDVLSPSGARRFDRHSLALFGSFPARRNLSTAAAVPLCFTNQCVGLPGAAAALPESLP